MLLTEQEILVPPCREGDSLFDHLRDAINSEIPEKARPIRLAVTATDHAGYHCEVGVLADSDFSFARGMDSLFELNHRQYEHSSEFNVALLVPTGIGAENGGHSGDAGALARFVAGCCDHLVTHPNVVNAADINELPENALYVEGSVISRLLQGTIGLQKVRANRVMVVIDEHPDPTFTELSINSVSAARAALGLDCPLVVTMPKRPIMRALYSKSGRAVGRIEYLERLCEVLDEHRNRYDAVALTSLIQVPERMHGGYFDRSTDMINPWGGVEAMLTHAVSTLFNVPSAHSPMMTSSEIMNLDVGVVDPRKSAEAVSTTYLHCILKGLHRSPRIIAGAPLHSSPSLLTAADLSCLVIPDGCVGLPTLAALEQGIPVIAVKDNRNCMRNRLDELPFADGKLFRVENYLEAVGVLTALRSGVAVATVQRPLAETVTQRHGVSVTETVETLALA